MDDQRRREVDLQAQIEQLEFDIEMQRRKQAKNGGGEDTGARRELMQL